jgi:hypothetical protein
MILFKVVNLGYQFKVFLLLVFRHCWCLSETAPTIFFFHFFFILFPLLKKYAILQGRIDKKELQRSRPTLARIFVGPTLATIQANIYKLFVPLFVF